MKKFGSCAILVAAISVAYCGSSFAADSAPPGSPACKPGVLGKAAVDAKCVEFTTVKTAFNTLAKQLDAVLKSPAQLALLKLDATKNLYIENVNFLADGRTDKKTIYNAYIKSSATTQINLPAAMKDKLDKLAATNKFEQMDFTEARASIAKLTADDAFTRFMKDK